MTVASTERARVLIASDIKAFDTQSRELIFEMQDTGWTGYVTARGHAFMLAPDGESTASVSRESLRGRSGRNARATFERWRREHDAKHRAPGASFGLSQDRPDPTDGIFDATSGPIPPKGSLAEMLHSQALRDLRGEVDTFDGNALFVYDEHVVGEWGCFDIRRMPAVLIAYGSTTTPEAVWARAAREAPELFAAPVTQGDAESEAGNTMQLYQCPDCDQTFEKPQLLGLHTAVKHTGPTRCTVEGCEFVAKTQSGLGPHMRTHKPKPPPPTPAGWPCKVEGCEFVAKTQNGLGPHMRTHRDVTVMSPVGAANGDVMVTAPDVLTEHLLTLPEGSDAEAMVASIRSIIAAPLVAEVRRLRDERAVHVEHINKLEHDNADLEAKLTIMRDALNL